MATQIPQSAELVGSIDDLLIEILLRLPIKSLVRFGLVSKHWQSLVKSSQFRRLYSSKQDPNVVGLFVEHIIRSNYYTYMPFSTDSDSKILNRNWFSLKIWQSCNGLLFCSDQSDHSRRFVCNPTTREVSNIPPPKDCSLVVSRTLCFDPAKSPIYKIVYVSQEKIIGLVYQIHMYSSDTRVWSVVGNLESSKGFIVHTRGNGVYWNGGVHWVGNVYSIYFNIEDGVISTFPSPLKAIHGSSMASLWESCDHMYCMVEFCYQDDWNVKLYELKRDRSEWFIKHQVNLSALCTTGHPSEIMSLVHGSEERDSFFIIIRVGSGLVRYNIVSKTFQELVKRNYSTQVFQHIESICPV